MKKLLFFVFIVSGIMLKGQSTIDILTLEGRYGFPQGYDSVLTSKATEKGIMGGLVAPIKFNPKTVWYNSVNYFYWNVTNDETLPAEIANPIQLHGFIVRTGLYQKFENGNAIQLFFSPRLMTDMNNVGGKSFQLGGLAMYEKEYNEDLKISYGLLLNQEMFGLYLVPLVNLHWQFSEYWSVTGLLPIYAKVKYQKNENFSAGFSHFGLLTTYHLGADAYQDDYIERMSIDLGLFARQKIANNLYLEGRLGHTFSRRYKQYAADQKVDFAIPLVFFGDDRVEKNINFKNGVIASLRIVYNVPIPDDE